MSDTESAANDRSALDITCQQITLVLSLHPIPFTYTYVCRIQIGEIATGTPFQVELGAYHSRSFKSSQIADQLNLTLCG